MLGYGGGACGTSFFMGLNAGVLPNTYYVSSHCLVNTLTHPYSSDPSGVWHNFAITTDSSGTDMYVDGVLRSCVRPVYAASAAGPDGFRDPSQTEQ
jgi:hypothetical protein